MTVTSTGNHRAGGHFQIFNLGLLFVQPLGSVPYLSSPALCRADITFHGSTDYGEHTLIAGMPCDIDVLHGCLSGSTPDRAAGFGSQGGQDAAQEAGRNGRATRARSYADCALEDMSANNKGKRNVF